MQTTELTGGCLCGRIRYTISDTPVWTGYCHCAACRKATGACAVTHVGTRPHALDFTETPSRYESSPGVLRGFCATCGTPLTYQSDRFDDYIQVYAGTLDDPNQVAPLAHVHVDEKIPWFDVADTLPRHAGSIAADDSDWARRASEKP